MLFYSMLPLPLIKVKGNILFLQVKIAMVGKYTGLADAYLSVVKVRLRLYKSFQFCSKMICKAHILGL